MAESGSVQQGRLRVRSVQISFSPASLHRSRRRVPCRFRSERWCTTEPRPGGPTAKRQPSPEGLGSMDDDPEHRRCGTLPQPDFAIPGRGTSSSNKINATESTNQLIWTALAESSPGCNHGLGWRERISPAGTAENDSEPVLSWPSVGVFTGRVPHVRLAAHGPKKTGRLPLPTPLLARSKI
jgi:hypothetical protein